MAQLARLTTKLGLVIMVRRSTGSSEAAERLSRRIERHVTGAEVVALEFPLPGEGAIAASTTFWRLVKQSDERTIICGQETRSGRFNKY